jgi:hypothetical protein
MAISLHGDLPIPNSLSLATAHGPGRSFSIHRREEMHASAKDAEIPCIASPGRTESCLNGNSDRTTKLAGLLSKLMRAMLVAGRIGGSGRGHEERSMKVIPSCLRQTPSETQFGYKTTGTLCPPNPNRIGPGKQPSIQKRRIFPGTSFAFTSIVSSTPLSRPFSEMLALREDRLSELGGHQLAMRT